ncbi:transposable element Tcb1 transposase [Trichonephila clavipes]|uniref:Transposable element Tcb1 transposase n=1 Tax=Trichonephila clavipes TaxID=2585209 RepID=A0A8X7BCM7_TRICX|nr:transposable element Tcb1 transposase [Trichonephila clavipes]
MVVNDRTASSRQLAASWSPATSILMSASSIRRRLLPRELRARVPLYKIPLTTNHRWLRIPGAIFEQNNARPRVSKTVRDFCSAQHVQLLPWSAYSSDILPIEHVEDLLGWRLSRDPYPAASKKRTFAAHTSNMEFFSTKQTFQICLTPCHVV